MRVFKSSGTNQLGELPTCETPAPDSRIHPKETHSVKVVVGICPFGIISQFLLTGAR
jgi:hypothetical protein